MKLVMAGVLVAGCTASVDAVQVPVDRLFFPIGVAVDPTERVLFVASANSDLQYNGGTISVIDLELVDQVIAGWDLGEVPDGCAGDPDHVETLVCEESLFLQAAATARMGNFATSIAVQDRGDGLARLFVPTRGDPSITWLDWDGAVLECGGDTCDDAHRLAAIDDDSFIPDEPFDAAAGTAGQFAIVSHLTSGAVTLLDSPGDGPATIADVTGGLFLSDSSGNLGASGVAVREGGMIYVGSNQEDRIQTLSVARPVNGAAPFLLQGDYFFLDGVGGSSGGSADTRALQFGRGGDRLYTVNREPPTLQIFDTSLDGAAPRNRFVDAFDVCRVASRLAVLAAAEADRLYVTCFQDGQVYVIDPSAVVAEIVTVGRGAFDVAVSRTRGRVYVTNFLEDTIAVLEGRQDSPLRDRVVLRIGTAREG